MAVPCSCTRHTSRNRRARSYPSPQIAGIVAGAKSTVDATLNYGARLRVRIALCVLRVVGPTVANGLAHKHTKATPLYPTHPTPKRHPSPPPNPPNPTPQASLALLALGALFYLLGFFVALPVILLRPAKFAICATMGSLLCLVRGVVVRVETLVVLGRVGVREPCMGVCICVC